MTNLHQDRGSYALLIGVGDYRAFDATGAHDLAAAPHDLRSMVELSRALGIAPENVHVLLSPREGDASGSSLPARLEGLTPGYIGPATADEVRAQVRWLAAKLGAGANSSHPAAGLFTYSGHGAVADGDLALCPSDVRKTDGACPDGVIGFQWLREQFAIAGGDAAELTVVLDCCHAGGLDGAQPGHAPTTLGGQALPDGMPLAPFAGRTLCACKAGELSYQSTFDGVPHGALTWALKVAVDQWRARRDGDADDVALTVSYGRLKDAAQGLLDTLGFDQRIQLLGPTGVDGLAFFQRGSAARPVSHAPDGPRPSAQVDEGISLDFTIYVLTVMFSDGSSYTASVVATVTAKAGWGYAAGKEYIGNFSGTWPPTPPAGKSVSWIKFVPTTGQAWGASNPLTGQKLLGTTSFTWGPVGGSGTNPLASLGGSSAYKSTSPIGVNCGGSSGTPVLTFATIGSTGSLPVATKPVPSTSNTLFDTATAPKPGVGQAWYSAT